MQSVRQRQVLKGLNDMEYEKVSTKLIEKEIRFVINRGRE